MVTSLSGSLRTISENTFASIATIPFSRISPSTIVSIPSSISFAVNLISLADASISMHSRMDIVVLEGTALETMLTPLRRFALEQINFMCITPFVGVSVFL